MLCNGLGRYEEALVAAKPAAEQEGLGLYTPVLVELIEAAIRSDQPQLAADALERLTERTRASGTEWALGTEARSRALLENGSSAETQFEEALRLLAHARVPRTWPGRNSYRRVASAREPALGRTRSASGCSRDVQPHRGRGLRGTHPS